MAYRTKVIMKPKNVIKRRLNLEEKGKVNAFATKVVAKKMDKYVPYRGGDLSDYYIIGNEIHYDQLYARYQYKGVREDGTHKINPANRTRTMHSLATSYWDKVMWANHKEEVIRQVENYIKAGAK